MLALLRGSATGFPVSISVPEPLITSWKAELPLGSVCLVGLVDKRGRLQQSCLIGSICVAAVVVYVLWNDGKQTELKPIRKMHVQKYYGQTKTNDTASIEP